MKVILLKDVQKIGKKFEVKNVSDGYALNYLIPRGLVEQATDRKIADLELKKKQSDEEVKVQGDLLQKEAEALNGMMIEVKVKANEKGHLFEGIHKDVIVTALGGKLTADQFILKNPIKEVGEHTIPLTLGDYSFVLNVVAE